MKEILATNYLIMTFYFTDRKDRGHDEKGLLQALRNFNKF